MLFGGRQTNQKNQTHHTRTNCMLIVIIIVDILVHWCGVLCRRNRIKRNVQIRTHGTTGQILHISNKRAQGTI